MWTITKGKIADRITQSALGNVGAGIRIMAHEESYTVICGDDSTNGSHLWVGGQRVRNIFVPQQSNQHFRFTSAISI